MSVDVVDLERERHVERAWTLAECVAALRVAVGRGCTQEEALADVLAPAMLLPPALPEWRPGHPNRADLYRLHYVLREICSALTRRHDALVAELVAVIASRGRPDLDEQTIAEAARLELRSRRRSWHAFAVRNRMVP